MKQSTFYLITGILAIQALVYLILSFGSLVDLITYLLNNSQQNLQYLSILALLPTTALNNLTSIWSIVLSFIAVLTFLILAYLYGAKSELGRIWIIFAVATFLFFGGEFIWGYYAILGGGVPDHVTLADFSWLTGYPFYILGLLLLHRQIGLTVKKNVFYLFTIVMIIISAIIMFVLGNAIYYPSAPLLDSTVYYAYVAGDLIMLYLAGLIFLKFSSEAEIRRSYLLLILAFAATAIGDILFAFSSWILGIYETYVFDISDAMYIIGYTLLIIGPLTYYYLVSKVMAQ